MKPQKLNLPCYPLSVTNANKTINLASPVGPSIFAVIENRTNMDVFVVSGKTAPTAVFPTIDSTAITGRVIGVAEVCTYELNQGDAFISAIQELAGGSGRIYVSVGPNI